MVTWGDDKNVNFSIENEYISLEVSHYQHNNFQVQTLNMLFQVLFLTVVALSTAHPTYHHGYAKPQEAAPEEINHNIDYKMSLNVQDDQTYNYQTREESKEGDVVRGQYTVLEPTGELRIVKYIADENGFQADVQNQPIQPSYAAPAPAYAAPPQYAQAPKHAAAPLVFAAPPPY